VSRGEQQRNRSGFAAGGWGEEEREGGGGGREREREPLAHSPFVNLPADLLSAGAEISSTFECKRVFLSPCPLTPVPSVPPTPPS